MQKHNLTNFLTANKQTQSTDHVDTDHRVRVDIDNYLNTIQMIITSI